MNIKNLSEIVHEGDVVKITFTVPISDFLKLVDTLKKVPKADKKVDMKELPDIADKKAKFSGMIKAFAAANPGLHPKAMYNQFYAYWTERSTNGKKIRYEGETYFDMAKRLATFRGNVKPEELTKMWAQEQTNQTA